MKLLTICPSNRPEQVKIMKESFYATRQGDADLLIYENNSRPLVDVINEGCKIGGYDYYQEVNDDHIYITPGWDIKLIETIKQNGGFGFVWGDDGWGDKNDSGLPSAVVMSANMVKALGYFFLPTLKHTYCDNVLLDIGRETGTMFYNPEVVIEHRHCLYKKAPVDDNYKMVMSKESMEYGKRTYELWAATQKAADIERVNNAVKSWRSDPLL